MKYHKKNQPTVLETIILGIGKVLWWLIALPFKGFRKSKGLTANDKRYILAKRREVENMLKSSSEIELKQAVLEADKLVDYILKVKGYEGKTFADRLRAAEKYLDNKMYQNIWQSHKIRNQLVHEDKKISHQELKQSANKLLNYVKV